MRSRVEVRIPAGGDVALLVDWMNLHDEAWETRLLPLAELVAASHPDAVWSAEPIPDEMSDKEAVTGHAH